MARVYTNKSAAVSVGSGADAYYQGYMDYGSSESATSVTYSMVCGIKSNRAVNVNFSLTQGATGYSNQSGTTYLSYGDGIKENDVYWNNWSGDPQEHKSYTYSKGHTTATKTFSLSCKATNGASDWRTTLTTSFSVTIPAKTSYIVSYNANGGTGSIGNQTKWYGENLTLSNGTGFTRQYYRLKGWNTKANGTGTHYNLSATYTGNGALTLYAEWELIAIPTKVKVNGSWYSGIIYTKVNGSWVISPVGYTKVNGVWKEIKP